MANYTIAQLKSDVEGFLHSTDTSQVRNFYNACRRAAQTLIGKIDPVETMRETQITNAVHDDIFDYSAPSDIKGDAVVDIRPQVNRQRSDSFSQRGVRTFDKYKFDGTFHIYWNQGTKTLRLSAAGETPITLHTMDSITANGTWAVGGDAANLTLDSNEYISGSASLNFDLNASGSAAYIENSTFDAIDLSDEDEVGSLWVRVFIPDTSLITNFILRWGSSSANYWSRTVTAPHDASSFWTGWNILRFDWNGATETGTVDASAIDYLRLTVTYNGTAETDIRVDKISASLGKIYELVYYSENLFRSSSGTWQAVPTDDSDLLNLDEDSYIIFFYEVAKICAQQMGGGNGKSDIDFCDKMLKGEGTRENPGFYHTYKANHPSQRLKIREYYWRKSTYDTKDGR